MSSSVVLTTSDLHVWRPEAVHIFPTLLWKKKPQLEKEKKREKVPPHTEEKEVRSTCTLRCPIQTREFIN